MSLAVLKASAEAHGHKVRCIDLNVDAQVWATQRAYADAFKGSDGYQAGDGFTRLWWVLTSHCLAFCNGGDARACERVLEDILPQHGFDVDRSRIQALVKVVEEYFATLDQVARKMEFGQYDVVGTSTCTTSLPASLYLLRKAKESKPDVVTVMGGGLYASDFAYGSENFRMLVDSYQYIDYFAVGEGEGVFQKLLDGQKFEARVLTTAHGGPKPVNLDTEPLPDLSDFGKDYLYLPVEGSRGCPFVCEFCSEVVYWGRFRKKSISVLVDQMVALSQRYGSRSFFLVDSLINPFFDDLASALIDRKLQFSFDGYCRADKRLHEDMCQTWARAGLSRARLGCESAAPAVLARMNKKTTPQIMAESLRNLARAGVRTTTYWVVGFPQETESDFNETLEFIRENHEYIYELEGHPCEQYEKGQVSEGKNLLRSVYSDETIALTRLKVWNLVGEPSNEVRHDRLRRLVKLAGELQLPNIYQMRDWYEAEKRWKRLRAAPSSRGAGTGARPIAPPVP
jgi:radical SAM superfamily enzyme YgiQ (UPF0313 family)